MLTRTESKGDRESGKRTVINPFSLMMDTIAKSLCGPPAAGSIIMKTLLRHPMSGGSIFIIFSMSVDRKHCWSASNARPDSSDWMRSGLSDIIVLSLSCLALLCHRGTRCSKCLHSAAFPSSLQCWHDNSTEMDRKIGAPVIASRILKSLV